MPVLGLSFSHNATACLIDEQNGEVIFCYSEERFTRRKNEWGFPSQTMRYILENVAQASSITRVAVGELCRFHYCCPEYAYVTNLADYGSKDSYVRSRVQLLKLFVKEKLLRLITRGEPWRHLVIKLLSKHEIRAPVFFFEHHHAHAASAFYGSPFNEALVITLDGEGDGLAGSCWLGRGPCLTKLHTIPETSSIGLFYKAITSLLGFRVNRDEGKVMSLAGYGNPERFLAKMQDLLVISGDDPHNVQINSSLARYHLKNISRRNIRFVGLMRYFPLFHGEKGWEDLAGEIFRGEFCRFFYKKFGHDICLSDQRNKEDIAAAAQQVIEESVLRLCRMYVSYYRPQKLVLAGGLFANVHLNQRIAEELDIDEFYVHPGMGDEGLAFGAAQLCRCAIVPGATRGQGMTHVYRGPDCVRDQVIACRDSVNPPAISFPREKLVEKIVSTLIDNKVVGLFRGRAEYGPRSLGHRSIIANPCHYDTIEALNRRIKREPFMPFAPTVLVEYFDELFESPSLAAVGNMVKYMTISLKVKPEWRDRIRAVIHVDGTSRPQGLSPEDDPFFHLIITRFFELTRIPCLLNTSFNRHGEPILHSPEDAMSAFRDNIIDALVLDDVFFSH